VVVSTGKAAVPVISLAMIGAVYGLQALIFILKREFMLIGWMFLYILAFPVYSVFLPIYSFWSMDDFSWGSTRKVIGEGNNKTIVYEDEMIYDDSMIPMKSFKGKSVLEVYEENTDDRLRSECMGTSFDS
jgi:chitin synthase